MSTLLEQAVAQIKAGDTEKAKQLLAEALKQNPSDENAWMWMTRCVGTDKEKRYCFERVLKINPQNQHAIEGMRRLTSPTIPTPPQQDQPRPQANRQSVSQQKPKNSNLLILAILAIIGFFGFICVFGVIYLRSPAPTNSSNSNQQNSPIPTQRRRPDYKSMLENNGFVYRMNDDEGDPLYVSPCGCVVTVKPDYLGFAAYVTDDYCPIEDMGRIISIMYPPAVLDFVASNMDVVSKDIIAKGTAAGHEIVMDFDSVDYKLVIIVRDR